VENLFHSANILVSVKIENVSFSKRFRELHEIHIAVLTTTTLNFKLLLFSNASNVMISSNLLLEVFISPFCRLSFIEKIELTLNQNIV